MTSSLRESYEELTYPSFSFAQTHPDRLATLGWLFGLTKMTLHGIAQVTRNTHPRRHPRLPVLDPMRYHTRQSYDVKTKVLQARAMLDLLAESLHATASTWGAMLLEEAQRVRQMP